MRGTESIAIVEEQVAAPQEGRLASAADKTAIKGPMVTGITAAVRAVTLHIGARKDIRSIAEAEEPPLVQAQAEEGHKMTREITVARTRLNMQTQEE